MPKPKAALFDLNVEIREPGKIIAIEHALAEQHIHDGERQRGVGARPQHNRHIRLLDRRRAVDIDHDELRATRLAGASHVRHDVDLGRDRVGAPHDDEVGIRHLARIGPQKLANAGEPARLGRRHADRGLLPRIAHGVAQAIEAIALQHTHVATGVIGPDGLRARALGDACETFRDLVERVVPVDRLEHAVALGALAPKRVEQPMRMLEPLGIARDLGAYDPQRVAVVARPCDPPDAAVGQQGHLERTGARTIVGAGGLGEASHQLWHAVSRSAGGSATAAP